MRVTKFDHIIKSIFSEIPPSLKINNLYLNGHNLSDREIISSIMLLNNLVVKNSWGIPAGSNIVSQIRIPTGYEITIEKNGNSITFHNKEKLQEV